MSILQEKNNRVLDDCLMSHINYFKIFEEIFAINGPYDDWLTLPKFIERFLDLEEKMAKIIRWSKYLPNNGQTSQAIRQHSVKQHTWSAVFFCCFLNKLCPTNEIDYYFLTQAFYYHDMPEGILEKDIPANEKNDSHDLIEYQVFLEYLEKKYFCKFLATYYHSAYLLQFVYSCHLDNDKLTKFPDNAQNIIKEIWNKKSQTAILFHALEIFGYFVYATEQYIFFGNQKIIEDVALHYTEQMSQTVEKINSLEIKKIIWPKPLADFLNELKELQLEKII